jgi:hypothetical protein
MNEEYYVKYKGRLQGPLTINQLKRGLKSGKLTRLHMVSKNRRAWVPLGDLDDFTEPPPATVPTETRVDISGQSQSVPPTQKTRADCGSEQPQACREVVRGATQYNAIGDSTKIMGWVLVSGIALLAALTLPIVVIVLNKNIVGFTFLWDVWTGLDGYGKFKMIFIATSGITLVVVSTTTKGLPRAITTIVAVTSLVIILNTKNYNNAMIRISVILVTCGVLSASLRWLLSGPSLVRRKFVCVASSIAAGVSIFFAIFYAVDIELQINRLQILPPYNYTIEVMHLILGPIGFGFGIAAGIIGILQIKQSSSLQNAYLALVFTGLSGLLSISEILQAPLFAVVFVALFIGVVYGTFELMIRSSEIFSLKPTSPPQRNTGNQP